ncbi:hypothetical protein [Bdellovibrio sp. HCB337]|uniref:hypothetical protein n=1 Tax=Bdellovibrio sp. HCB337 TaxID=3394358 RepID=UPI0039A40437
MLQKILSSIFILSLSFVTTAKAVIFSAPGADSMGLQKMAVQRNQQTYTQWMLEKISQSGAEAHAQVLDFSERALQNSTNKQILTEWELLRQNLELNSADRELLLLLAEKLKLSQELCRYTLLDPTLESLLENPESIRGCAQKAQAISLNFLRKLKDEDLVVIEGKVFSKGQVPAKLWPGNYQWKVISNSYEDYSFQSSMVDLGQKVFTQKAWIEGSCENYKLNHKDFSVLVQAQVYFNEGCIVPGVPPEKNFKTWAKEHKTLLWGLGIVAAGFAAYQLRDKTVVITTP